MQIKDTLSDEQSEEDSRQALSPAMKPAIKDQGKNPRFEIRDLNKQAHPAPITIKQRSPSVSNIDPFAEQLNSSTLRIDMQQTADFEHNSSKYNQSKEN
jgi:hypothetical protein